MNYRETIEYLFSSLPMFQRIGDAAVKKDLTNIKALSQLLGNPHERFPSIHIAGTNGKGSTSHMLASVFQRAGQRVGLYTSPHYADFRERIKVNGEMMSRREVIHFVSKYKDEWELIGPSFFEITVAMAFDHFRRHRVDIAIIETGLGGRLDSTNIITPLLSVITNIGFDHMSMLGNTLPEIASEKAGIIKPAVPVVIGEWDKGSSPVFRAVAKHLNAPITFASKQIRIEAAKSDHKNSRVQLSSRQMNKVLHIKTDLTGPYQIKNIRTVVQAVLVWNTYYPDKKISMRVLRAGLKDVKGNTGMIGRWMILRQKPLVITDAAHNVDGMKNIIPSLCAIKAYDRHFVLGFVADKDITKILRLFPKTGTYYWCTPDLPRGKAAEETAKIGQALGLTGDVYKSVYEAYKAALTSAGVNDLVFIGGSSYVVGELLAKIRGRP